MIALLILFLLTSCLKTEVVNAPIQKDTLVYKPRKENIEYMDTTRVPITFTPTVQDWNDTTITITPSGKL
jgi:hypothetical protein